jgi:hypothetical protein
VLTLPCGGRSGRRREARLVPKIDRSDPPTRLVNQARAERLIVIVGIEPRVGGDEEDGVGDRLPPTSMTRSPWSSCCVHENRTLSAWCFIRESANRISRLKSSFRNRLAASPGTDRRAARSNARRPPAGTDGPPCEAPFEAERGGAPLPLATSQPLASSTLGPTALSDIVQVGMTARASKARACPRAGARLARRLLGEMSGLLGRKSVSGPVW